MGKRKSIASLALTVLFFTAGLSELSAQDTQFVRLDEAIKATLNNSKAIKLATFDEAIAASNYKQTEAIYLPEIGLSYTAFSTNNPLNAFGFKLQQKSITQNDFNPELLNHPKGTADFTTRLEVQQPLLNMDLLYKRKAAEKQIDVFRYKTQRTKEYLTFEVQKAYLQLQMAYKSISVLEDALQTARSVYTYTDNHYKQGLIQKSDLLDAQVHISSVESNLVKAKSSTRNLSDYLGLLMGRSDGIVYTVDSSQQGNDPTQDTTGKIATSRSDFRAMEKAIEASDLMIKSSRMSYLPKLNAFGNYQLNDSRPAGFGANTYLAGLQLTWDIFRGQKTRNAISTQVLERNKMTEELQLQKEQAQLELNKAYRDLSDAQTDIAQQKLAITKAAESLQILQNRYAQGLVNTTDVLRAATQFSQQKFALAQAVYSTDVARAWLQLLTTTANK